MHPRISIQCNDEAMWRHFEFMTRRHLAELNEMQARQGRGFRHLEELILTEACLRKIKEARP